MPAAAGDAALGPEQHDMQLPQVPKPAAGLPEAEYEGSSVLIGYWALIPQAARRRCGSLCPTSSSALTYDLSWTYL
jgi:hypothetical protein